MAQLRPRIVGLVMILVLGAAVPGVMAQGVSPQEATEIATDAYVYGYSLVTTEVTRVQMRNVPKIETLSAPMNAAPRTGASLGEGAERRCGPDPPQRSERPGSARGVTA